MQDGALEVADDLGRELIELPLGDLTLEGESDAGDTLAVWSELPQSLPIRVERFMNNAE